MPFTGGKTPFWDRKGWNFIFFNLLMAKFGHLLKTVIIERQGRKKENHPKDWHPTNGLLSVDRVYFSKRVILFFPLLLD